MSKPIVGITTFCKREVNHKDYNKVRCSYMEVIAKAGGVPILIPLMEDLDLAKKYIDLVDALILSGGQDISPKYYDADYSDYLGEIDPVRDKWELKLFELAYQSDLPILGICRGMQLINVGSGGTLYQDIIEEYDENLRHVPDEIAEGYTHHNVSIEDNCNLCNFACGQEFDVNSHHHQAIKELAPRFKVIAKTEGNLIEAIESKDKDFVIGVQWHPEDLTDLHPCFNQLFVILVEKAIKKNDIE